MCVGHAMETAPFLIGFEDRGFIETMTPVITCLSYKQATFLSTIVLRLVSVDVRSGGLDPTHLLQHGGQSTAAQLSHARGYPVRSH